MKKGANIWLIILGILVIVLILYFYLPSSTNNEIQPVEQNCTEQNGYCVYNNIPPQLYYYSPGDIIPEESEISDPQELEDYLYYLEYPPEDPNDSRWRCTDSDKEPVIIKFYDEIYEPPEGTEGMIGFGGIDRSAFVCGDIYIVQDFHPSAGPIFYGPFEVAELKY